MSGSNSTLTVFKITLSCPYIFKILTSCLFYFSFLSFYVCLFGVCLSGRVPACFLCNQCCILCLLFGHRFLSSVTFSSRVYVWHMVMSACIGFLRALCFCFLFSGMLARVSMSSCMALVDVCVFSVCSSLCAGLCL